MNFHVLSSIMALSVFLGAVAPIPIPKKVAKSVKNETKILDESNGDNRLLVFRFGSPPQLLKEKFISGNGLHVLVINRKRTACCFEASWGEIEPDAIIDYSKFSSGILEITGFTSDPRPEMRALRPEGYGENDGRGCDWVPFERTTVRMAPDGTCKKQERLLLKPEPADNLRIKALVAETRLLLGRMDTETKELFEKVPGAGDKLSATEGRFCDDLAHLRNMSPGDPDAVMKAFKTIGKDKRLDGAWRESYDRYLGEAGYMIEIGRK